MLHKIESKLLPFVIKPGRYTGGEPGSIVKDPANRVKYLHAYPDKYDVGQSYVGLQTIYHIINSDDRFLCERVFAVDSDAEEIMRRENIELFSLESKRPAREFDAFGFTIPFELVYTNVLAMLELAGIPLMASERSKSDPLILAGGPSVFNPEPIAPFFDLIYIGDCEEGLPQLLNLIGENKNLKRADKLKLIAQTMPSVYVPSLYDDNHQPLDEATSKTIKASLISELKPENYPDQPIVPLIDTAHRHLSVEIMRGCPQGCRFCMAGTIYRPVRTRSQADIMRQVETQIKNSGYADVALLSLSSSDYPEIEQLATTVAKRMEPQRVAISLPALRPGTIKPELLEAASKVRKSGLTIAPEAGTERLRLFIRKDFPDEAIYDTVRIAYAKGWTTIKLYFMVGLPTETEEDLLGIVKLVENISAIGRDYAGRKTINVTLSPFTPKPHTPFQWDEQIEPDETLRRINFIKRSNRAKTANYKYSSVESLYLQGILGRGDRQLAQVIKKAYEKGCRFDAWNESFHFDLWCESFSECDIDPDKYLKAIPFTADLPWSHISKGPSIEGLRKERERTSLTLKEFVPMFQSLEEQGLGEKQVAYGRGLKKVITRNQSAPTKNRLRLRWAKTARYKYMSHLDNIRLMERLIRRSGVPIAYSQGFNPSMKLSFGPPLPLGFTSEAEYVDIQLESNLMNYMVDNIRKVFPEGLTILDAKAVFGKTTSLSAALNRIVYSVNVDSLKIEKDKLLAALDRLMKADELIVDRIGKSETKRIDVRPGLYELKLEENELLMTLGIGEGKYTKPTEMIDLLVKELNSDADYFEIHRKDIYKTDNNGDRIEPMDI